MQLKVHVLVVRFIQGLVCCYLRLVCLSFCSGAFLCCLCCSLRSVYFQAQLGFCHLMYKCNTIFVMLRSYLRLYTLSDKTNQTEHGNEHVQHVCRATGSDLLLNILTGRERFIPERGKNSFLPTQPLFSSHKNCHLSCESFEFHDLKLYQRSLIMKHD